jgi:hypothetical protein
MVTIAEVEVLGIAPGNLWNVFIDGTFVARVAYNGNTLEVLRGVLPTSKAKVARMINALYASSG